MHHKSSRKMGVSMASPALETAAPALGPAQGVSALPPDAPCRPSRYCCPVLGQILCKVLSAHAHTPRPTQTTLMLEPHDFLRLWNFMLGLREGCF